MDEAVTVRGGLVWTGDVLAQWGRWTRKHLGMTILLSVLAFVFGWLWNTYIMAVELEGYVVDPDGETIATAEGQPLNGLFWLLLFSLLSGLISYGWQRGWRTMATDLAAIPRRFGETGKSFHPPRDSWRAPACKRRWRRWATTRVPRVRPIPRRVAAATAPAAGARRS